MIDCSHGNSQKDHRNQAAVSASIAEQVAAGSWRVMGAMLESHLVEGRQDYVPGQAAYGQSITDACLSLEQTEPLLELLAAAQQKRGSGVKTFAYGDVPRWPSRPRSRWSYSPDAAAAQIPRPPAAADGDELFATTCQVCHGQAGHRRRGPGAARRQVHRRLRAQGAPGGAAGHDDAGVHQHDVAGRNRRRHALRRAAAGARRPRARRPARRCRTRASRSSS